MSFIKRIFGTRRKDGSDQKTKRLVVLSTLAVFMGVILIGMMNFYLSDLIESLEVKTYDFRMALQWGNDLHKKPSPDVVIVKYDDPTLSALEEEYGTWPWPRKIHAGMMDFLTSAGAKAVAFDMMFVSHQRGMEDSDQILIDAFQKYPNVYISMNFDNNWKACNRLGKAPKLADVDMLHPLSMPLDVQLSSTSNANLKLKDGFYDNDAMTFNNFRRIMPELMAVQDRIAFINHGRDKDGVSRGNPLFFRFAYLEPVKSLHPPYTQKDKGTWQDAQGLLVTQEGTLLDAMGQPKQRVAFQYFPYLGMKIIMDLKLPNKNDRHFTLTPNGHLKFPGYDVPLASNGSFLINWYNVNVEVEAMKRELAKYQAYREKLLASPKIHTSAYQKELNQVESYIKLYQENLNKPYEAQPYREISAWEVLTAAKNEKAGKMTPEDLALKKFFKDKIIFVGTTAVSTYDIKTTPISKLLPGVILQATVFDNLYQNTRYMHRAEPKTNYILAGILCLLVAITIFNMRSAISGLLTIVSVAVLYMAIATLIFKSASLWLDIAMPMVMLTITTTLTFMVKYMSRDEDYKHTYRLATTDGLTGLYNHRFFQDHLVKAIAAADRFNSKFSLILIDIDFFKKFNDTYGHQAGDEVLRHVARKLKNSVRSVDLVARYGGEEMAVILEKASDKEGLEVAEKLVRLVAEEAYPIAEGVEKHVTISVGVATYPGHGKTPAELIEFADLGLYRAKKNGRNQVGAQYDEPGTVPSFEHPPDSH